MTAAPGWGRIGAGRTELVTARFRALRALVAVTRAAAGVHGGGALPAARLARRVRRRQGFEYAEALRAGLLDPGMPDAVRSAFASRHATLQALAPLNGGGAAPAIARDKWVFYRYCAALGLPVPDLLAVIDRRGPGWGAPARVVAGRADRDALVADLPDEFVVKPSEGYGGRGVAVVRREGAGGVWDAIAADPEFDVWILQERLANHPAVAALAGDAGLHTVRVTSLVARDGSIDLIMAYLKLSLSGRPADNFQAGASGNAIAWVDVASGRLGPLTTPRADGAGMAERDDNPVTGARVAGAIVPGWDAVGALVRRAAPAFLPLRAVGWDVAITPTGPVLVEANTRWLPFPGPAMGGVLRRLLEA